MNTDTTTLRLVFAKGLPVRGESIQIKPSFFARLKLLFSRDFQVRIGGRVVKSTLRGRLKLLFSKKFTIRQDGPILGLGLYEEQLVLQGVEKRELRAWVTSGKLLKVTTREQGAWRTTYVLPKGDK